MREDWPEAPAPWPRVTSRAHACRLLGAVPRELYVVHASYKHSLALREQVQHLTLVPGQELVLDLSGLQFRDSTGITALLAARQHAQAAGTEVILAAAPATPCAP
ncbi:STAS domain-containing protein [Streptantibioticus parmotrematis]|uniref:STAS domain-containing protein n=1 Tax=Streptantibioticus parmotrematis TaxID=2873249 RepID=UPI0027E0020C|nr:STAS domain-containing protein [Streptantibioticus parmotrematis]